MPASARLLFLLGVSLSAADRTVPPVIELARTGPPEFFADAVVRIIQSGKIPQRDTQVELLEQAFAIANSAREPIRLIAIPGTPPDTREIYRGKAGDLALDRLSLQSRIVRELVTLDRVMARALFDAMTRPKLAPRPCSDPLIADASPYYDAAAAIAQSAFTEKEKQTEAHVQFLTALLAGAQSPNEIAAWTRAVQSVALLPAQWRLLVAALAAKLDASPLDYRPFVMSLDSLAAEIRNIEAIAGTNELSQPFRKYVVTQLKAARCSPDLALDPVSWLDPPVSEDESKPSSRKESFESAQKYFESADSKQLGDSLNALRTAVDDRRARFSDVLRDFNGWRPDGSNVDVFHQKATVLRALLEMTPPGEDRERVLNLALSFLRSSAVERESPAQWLWEARTIVELANADASKLVAAFPASGNVSLSLYAQLGYFGVSSGTSK